MAGTVSFLLAIQPQILGPRARVVVREDLQIKIQLRVFKERYSMPPSSSFWSAVRSTKAEFLPMVGCQLKYDAVPVCLLVNFRMSRRSFDCDLCKMADGNESANVIFCGT